MKDKIEIRTKVYEMMYEALRDAGIMLLVIALLMIVMAVAGCSTIKDFINPPKEPAEEPTEEPIAYDVIQPVNVPAIWCECGSAFDLGVKDAVTYARSGMAGASTFYVIHPNCDTGWNNDIQWPRSKIEGAIDYAVQHGYAGVAVDLEHWALDEQAIINFREITGQLDVPLILVPSAATRVTGKTFAETVPILNANSDAVFIWDYSADAQKYEKHIDGWRDAGYTKQIGVIQDTFRTHGNLVGGKAWKGVVSWAMSNDVPFMLFAGNSSTKEQIEAYKDFYR